MILQTIVLVIHVLMCVTLVFLVLLHSGRGSGLSDMFGGGLGAAASGSTMVEKNLDRMTIGCATTFAFTTVALSLMLSK